MTKVVSTYDIRRLVSTAIQAADSHIVERCVDVLRYLTSLILSSKDIRLHSPPIHALVSRLRSHKNPKIVSEVNVLLDSWLKTLYSSPNSNKAIPAKKNGGVEKSLLQTKKRSLNSKLSENPKPNLKENTREMLELFEIAKKSADVANTKGLLFSKAETKICVDTLSLLISFPISSTATETRKIMEKKLQYLTKHKDRKICNSASALLQHWRQCITESH